MSYLIVKFLDEEATVSEVPSEWLEDEHNCWWPSTKNVANLIKKRTLPDKSNLMWRLYPVKVMRKFDDYEKARRKAEQSESSSSEIDMGKGKRKKIVRKRNSKLEDDTDSLGSISSRISDIPQYPDLTEDGILGSHKVNSKSSMVQLSTNKDPLPLIVLPSNTNDLNLNRKTSLLDNELETNRLENERRQEDVNVTYFNVSTDELVNELRSYVKEQFEKTHKMIAQLILVLERSGNIGVALNPDNLKKLQDIFPINDWTQLEEMELTLTNKDEYEDLVKYFKSIGGSNLKDKIIRILKRIFSNKLISEASWMGRRKNRKICDLITIKAIKGSVYQSPDFNEKQFEEAASEWIRQGKQRYQREQPNQP